ncbi:MAG: hypothetical protein L6R38_005272 [Xanthoria sp. 2 TBL-2021]|nr:MAG: hypothetical protein L6R38_005272 [Xanthoria sp. 2 TBL-2021]
MTTPTAKVRAYRRSAYDTTLDETDKAAQVSRSERSCSPGSEPSAISAAFSSTLSSQWLERTPNDSAIRRIDMSHQPRKHSRSPLGHTS